MAAKDRRSHDQKRKVKLAKRAKRQHSTEPRPYEGKKYQADAWVPHVYETERAIYEAILLSNRRLTNAQVHDALVKLINYLRADGPPLLAEGEPDAAFAPGSEVEYLVWNIRRHWRVLFQQQGNVSGQDLIGILRTLLYSLEAHAWHTGKDRGYVAFLDDFMRRGRL